MEDKANAEETGERNDRSEIQIEFLLPCFYVRFRVQ